ncbi:MAG: winged helix-turn-helix transcriptional regulator [Proteobacteria bacterium]|nr:winged helix-turn-helix transcriptional regulator [Pseudomonadota bacterium]
MNTCSYITILIIPKKGSMHNRSIKSSILSKESAIEIAELFKTFGDATRIQILELLTKRELCVGEISESLEMSQSSISHQLRLMRNNHLLKKRKEGRHIYYSIKDQHIVTMLNQGKDHTQESSY